MPMANKIARADLSRSATGVVEWRPNSTSALIGHVSIEFPGGWQIHACSVFRGRDGLCVASPSIPLLDAEGRVRIGPDGKKQFQNVITFAAGRDRWRDMTAAAPAAAGITGNDDGTP